MPVVVVTEWCVDEEDTNACSRAEGRPMRTNKDSGVVCSVLDLGSFVGLSDKVAGCGMCHG